LEKCKSEVNFTVKAWDKRFSQQATWTKDLRDYIFEKANLPNKAQVLEVGCGTGAFLKEIPNKLVKFGIDFDFNRLIYGKTQLTKANLACSNAKFLPFPNQSFDMTVCHYFLLWLHDPLQVLREMRRVTKKEGVIAAFAEPDYGLATGYSDVIIQICELQIKSLSNQGANPLMGRQLVKLFNDLGLNQVETGRLDTDTGVMDKKLDLDLELEVIENDIKGLIENHKLHALLSTFRKEIQQSPSTQEVPTFFAFGFV
jgi:SAM-dependent methyltransferase